LNTSLSLSSSPSTSISPPEYESSGSEYYPSLSSVKLILSLDFKLIKEEEGGYIDGDEQMFKSFASKTKGSKSNTAKVDPNSQSISNVDTCVFFQVCEKSSLRAVEAKKSIYER
jgi:hypothetical protein